MHDNLAKINEIAGEIEVGLAAVIPRRSMPTIAFTHDPHADDVARLTAEALAVSYEAAAHRIEEMSHTLTQELKSCEVCAVDIVRELDKYKETTQHAVEDCKRAAETYRDEAKLLFAHVQSRAMVADKVRKLCNEMIGDIRT